MFLAIRLIVVRLLATFLPDCTTLNLYERRMLQHTVVFVTIVCSQQFVFVPFLLCPCAQRHLHKEMVYSGLVWRSVNASIAPWPQPHPTPLEWTERLTLGQTWLPSISVEPRWFSFVWMGANPSSQVPTSGREPERVEDVTAAHQCVFLFVAFYCSSSFI